MITILHDKIANYVTKNALLSDWRNIREYYARYSFLAFMCLIANNIDLNCNVKNIGNILYKNFLYEKEIVKYVLATNDALNFMFEILEAIRKQESRDINEI